MYNKDEKYFIYRTTPSTGGTTTCLMHKARCNNTNAKIQKVNVM